MTENIEIISIEFIDRLKPGDIVFKREGRKFLVAEIVRDQVCLIRMAGFHISKPFRPTIRLKTGGAWNEAHCNLLVFKSRYFAFVIPWVRPLSWSFANNKFLPSG